MEPRPYDTFVHECSIWIDAAVETVWAVVSDLGHSLSWAGSGRIHAVEKVTDGPVGLGSTYITETKSLIPLRAENEVIAYEANSLIAWHTRPARSHTLPHRWSFHLLPENDGTRLSHRVRMARRGGMTRLRELIASRLYGGTEGIAEEMEQTLWNVKRQSEEGRS